MTQAQAKIGHNSGETEAKDVGGVSGKRLLSFIERVELLEQEKAERVEDIKEVLIEAKSVGFCSKTIRKVVKLRAMESEKRAEEQALLELYANAVQLNLF